MAWLLPDFNDLFLKATVVEDSLYFKSMGVEVVHKVPQLLGDGMRHLTQLLRVAALLCTKTYITLE